MAERTSIEWAANADGSAGATWNPIRAEDRETGKIGTHCVHMGEGCRHCYAETWNMRGMSPGGTGLPYTKQSEQRVIITLDERMLTAPLLRKKPTTYFLTSMSDLYADFVTDAMLDEIKAVQALCPQHTFIEVTKRSKRARDYNNRLWPTPNSVRVGHPVFHAIHALGARFMRGSVEISAAGSRLLKPLKNVWLLVSCENQRTADERIVDLMATSAAVRGISGEPLLEGIDIGWALSRNPLEIASGFIDRGSFSPGLETLRRLDWVIVGGESGAGARPMHPAWARSLRDQCNAAGVPFFFKQWGAWKPVCEMPGDEVDALYHPAPVKNPEGHRRCKVERSVVHDDGSMHDIAAPAAYLAGTQSMLMFRVGKGNAGRVLEGRTHDGRPPFLTELKVAA